MKFTTTGKIDISNIKRCYVNGAEIITSTCPDCGETLEQDISEDYISYPEIDVLDDFVFYCERCDDHYKIPMTVKSAIITIEFDPAKITRD